ncbi:MAG TPA: hypothetical protein VM243_02175 [Phycisphaerae bacterium]|nr:hypothetical protein [Phycisphaerae bacterium]
MSTFIAFKCPDCGAKAFDPEPCYVCGGSIDFPVECGVEKAPGFPNVVKDHMAPHMDYAVGRVISSRSERNKVYDAMGVVPKSYTEFRRQHPTNTSTHHNMAVSYPGQKRRRSTAEKTSPRFV